MWRAGGYRPSCVDWHWDQLAWPLSAERSPRAAARLTLYVCVWCGLGFRDPNLMERHQRLQHPKREPKVLVFPASVGLEGAGYDY